MGRKQMSWKTKGMNRDLSVSAFNPEFAFENRNLRLSTNESNTLLSWVNERGTMEMPLSIQMYVWEEESRYGEDTILGTPIGTAVINHKLVIFTHDNDSTDYIYLLWFNGNKKMMYGEMLFRGNLGFSTNHPIETLVSYESDTVQKVYWTDGINQPRVINIAADRTKLKKWNDATQEMLNNKINTIFDFVPSFGGNEQVTIEKSTSSGGIFAPGVIQYAFTYVNNYGQQSNIVYVSPLYYLSPYDRGASPEEKVVASFHITIKDVNHGFDFIRLYSIQRTSINATPFVKLLETLVIPDTEDTITLEYTDSGTTGASMDPTEMLFLGGKEIAVATMKDKDGTLFFGNITEKHNSIRKIQEYYDGLRKTNASDTMGIEYHNDGECKQLTLDKTSTFYAYTNTLKKNKREITTFKGGETYRFGFQLQKKTGEWSEPIFMNDVENPLYPKTNIFQDNLNLVYASAEINLAAFKDLVDDFDEVYHKIRPVIVHPGIGDRTVLCQGVLNPTVFNAEDRKTSSPYAQASWFFRPYILNGGMDSWDNISFVEDPKETPPYEVVISQRGTVTPCALTPKRGVYALVASVSSGNMDKILSRKTLSLEVSQSNGGSLHYEPILGIIRCPDQGNGDYRKYIFIRENCFPYDRITDDVAIFDGTQLKYLDLNGSYKAMDWASSAPYEIYADLEVKDGFFRYMKKEGYPDQYVFECCAGNEKYTVTFNALDADDNKITVVTSGSPLRYRHYDSIYGQSEYEALNVSSNNGTNSEAAQRIEIQGSVNAHNSVTSDTSSNSNTQFFIDQSIVTLNSPDIEFDTEVQAYGTEGIFMRVVGIIPITAYSSAHSITHGTMLGKKLTSSNDMVFGKGELPYNIRYKNINPYAGLRLVSGFFWEDMSVKLEGINTETKEDIWIGDNLCKFLVYPWQRRGSLNNDTRSKDKASSLLQQKKESSLLFSINSGYLSTDKFKSYSKIGMQVCLTENAEVMNYRLPKQMPDTMDINYYPNIDKVLNSGNENGYQCLIENGSLNTKLFSPISMKYLSTSHAVLGLMAGEEGTIPLLPRLRWNKNFYESDYPSWVYRGGYTKAGDPLTTFWGDTQVFRNEEEESITDLTEFFKYNGKLMPLNLLWLGELYKEVPNRFGGKTQDAIRANNWIVGGDTVKLDKESSTVTLNWTEGDTYYQRYDCLKTYAMTPEDDNQLVEILSFMCETHVNIDGRYDKNRGAIDNTMMSPRNFNKLNPAYSQADNFFTYKKTDREEEMPSEHPNLVTWSKTKESGADVDLWTNVTLANTLELDGDKGEITSLQKLNNQLIAFQDSGISQILYNERAQISTTAGVPIELANSGKVDGKSYISDTIGCSNKWSIVNTPSGIYFMDSNDKSINLFNGKIQSVSASGGFNTWCKQHIPSSDMKWNPVSFGAGGSFNSGLDLYDASFDYTFHPSKYSKDVVSSFVGYYDRLNQDVLYISKTDALAFSEKLGVFTSFYDYGDSPFFCNIDDASIWLRADGTIWGHQTGNYCQFFGKNKPYWMTLIGNPEPTLDKIFNNLEFRANVAGEGTEVTGSWGIGKKDIFGYTFDYTFHPAKNNGTSTRFTPFLPFDSLETWNEYQHGKTTLQNSLGRARYQHEGGAESSLLRKFRIWRCDIPRDNCEVSDEEIEMGIYRTRKHPVDRMRNPWLYVKLFKKAAASGEVLGKAEVHDIVLDYLT